MLLLSIKTSTGADCNPECSFPGRASISWAPNSWMNSLFCSIVLWMEVSEKVYQSRFTPSLFPGGGPLLTSSAFSGGRGIRQQWKETLLYLHLIALAWCPELPMESAVRMAVKTRSDWQKNTESQGSGMAVSRAHHRAGPDKENFPWVTLWDIPGLVWGSLSWLRAGKLHQSQIYTRKWRNCETLPWPRS